MTGFDEANTVEALIRDLLCGDPLHPDLSGSFRASRKVVVAETPPVYASAV